VLCFFSPRLVTESSSYTQFGLFEVQNGESHQAAGVPPEPSWMQDRTGYDSHLVLSEGSSWTIYPCSSGGISLPKDGSILHIKLSSLIRYSLRALFLRSLVQMIALIFFSRDCRGKHVQANIDAIQADASSNTCFPCDCPTLDLKECNYASASSLMVPWHKLML